MPPGFHPFENPVIARSEAAHTFPWGKVSARKG